MRSSAVASGPEQGKERTLGAYSFTAQATGGKTAVFQMDFLGNGGPVADMRLFRLLPSGAIRPFTYRTDGPLRNGSFWIASLQEPPKGLPPKSVLRMDASYMVFFVLDAGTPENGASALLTVTVALTTSGVLPVNGGVDDIPCSAQAR